MKEDIGELSHGALGEARAVSACCGRGAYHLSNYSIKLPNLRWFLLPNFEDQ